MRLVGALTRLPATCSGLPEPSQRSASHRRHRSDQPSARMMRRNTMPSVNECRRVRRDRGGKRVDHEPRHAHAAPTMMTTTPVSASSPTAIVSGSATRRTPAFPRPCRKSFARSEQQHEHQIIHFSRPFIRSVTRAMPALMAPVAVTRREAPDDDATTETSMTDHASALVVEASDGRKQYVEDALLCGLDHLVGAGPVRPCERRSLRARTGLRQTQVRAAVAAMTRTG